MAKNPPITDPDIEPLLRAINFFASECEDFTPQLLKVFLYVATHNGCRMEQITRGTGVGSSAVSYITRWLSDGQYKAHKPLGWVVKQVCPLDHRSRVLFLTKRGQSVADNLKAQLYPED